MRMGLIRASEEFVNGGILPEVFFKIGATPIQIFEEKEYSRKVYKCIGDCFDEVLEDEIIKYYDPNITKDKNGELQVKL